MILSCTISSYLAEKRLMDWNASLSRICCQGHILNLIVQAYLSNNDQDEEEMDSYDKEDELGRNLDEKVLKKE